MREATYRIPPTPALKEGFLPPDTLFLLLLIPLALATPTANEFAAAWQAHQIIVQAGALQPVALTAQDFDRLAKTGIARRRVHMPGADRVVGMIWSPAPRDTLWVSILDDADFTLVDSLTEIRLADTAGGHKRLYQHLDLPWPVENRHWVIEIKNNTQLAMQTGDQIWERVWDLTSPDDIPAGRPEAIWAPVADGGWLLLPAGGGTLVVYHARSVIGGHIPDELVTRWSMATLGKLLEQVVDRAQKIPRHYTGEHPPIYRPDGSAVPRW